VNRNTGRRFGSWVYHPSYGGYLDCGQTFIYLRRCGTAEERAFWLKHIGEKPWGDATGLKLAFHTLLGEGVIKDKTNVALLPR